jgi:hypothetical protein
MEQKNNDLEALWKEREKALGEAISARALLHVIQSDSESISSDSWCVGILTGTRLIVQGGETQNWLSAVFQAGRFEKRTAPELCIPRDCLLSMTPIRPTGFFGKLFQRADVHRIQWKTPTGVLGMTVEVENGEDFIRLLRT